MTHEFPRDAEGRVDARAFFDRLWRPVRFHDLIGLEFVEADIAVGTATLRLPYRIEHTNLAEAEGAGIHGGAIASLVDAATSYILTAVTENYHLATVNMRVDYLAWTGHTSLLAHARVVKAGRSIAVTDCDVRDEAGRLCASGRVTFGLSGAYKGAAKVT